MQIPVNEFIRRTTFVVLIATTVFLTACGPDTNQTAGKLPVTEPAKTEAVETAAIDEQVNGSRITREGVISGELSE